MPPSSITEPWRIRQYMLSLFYLLLSGINFTHQHHLRFLSGYGQLLYYLVNTSHTTDFKGLFNLIHSGSKRPLNFVNTSCISSLFRGQLFQILQWSYPSKHVKSKPLLNYHLRGFVSKHKGNWEFFLTVKKAAVRLVRNDIWVRMCKWANGVNGGHELMNLITLLSS